MRTINAVTYLKDFKTEGHKPILVLADDNLKYVIKPYRSNGFDYCIFNELLANYFLKIWQINTPEFALIKVKKEVLKNSVNASYYKSMSFQNYFFGSLFIENSFELNNFLSFSKKIDFKKIREPEKLLILGLFDIWVENDDRKPTNYNILLNNHLGKFNIVAIDNAFIFSNLTYSELNPEFICNSFNDNVLYSSLTKQVLKKIKPNKKWVEHHRDLYYLYIRNCENNFDKIITEIEPFFKLNQLFNVEIKLILVPYSPHYIVALHCKIKF